MKEKQLTTLAIATSILGIILLAIILPTNEDDKNQVMITGKIISIEQKEKVTTLKIKTETPIKIAIFEKTDFQNGDEVKITGKLQEYRGRLEIIADRIEKKE